MDSKLIEYIKKELVGGNSEEKVRLSLKENGWADQALNDAFLFVRKELQPPAPLNIPVPPPPAPARQNINSADFHDVPAQRQSMPRQRRTERPAEPKKPDLNSPYSVILSVGLLLSLFVLGNQVFSDLSDISDLARKLAIEAAIFVPFLLITSILSFMVNSSGKKYKILVYPFYLLSGWLFLRLFAQTIIYIYDQSATFGIYVALGLIIALLTGVILFVQRNMSKNKQ